MFQKGTYKLRSKPGVVIQECMRLSQNNLRSSSLENNLRSGSLRSSFKQLPVVSQQAQRLPSRSADDVSVVRYGAIPEAMMDDESKVNSQLTSSRQDEDEAVVEEGMPQTAAAILRFLQSDRGHQLANKGLELIDSIKRATLDERAKAHALDGELKRLSLRQTWWIKTLGLVIVVAAIVALSATNTLRPEAATILGAVAGFLFAQQSKGASS